MWITINPNSVHRRSVFIISDFSAFVNEIDRDFRFQISHKFDRKSFRRLKNRKSFPPSVKKLCETIVKFLLFFVKRIKIKDRKF